MKKVFLSLVFAFLAFPLIAGNGYQLDLISLDPLHKEYMAYRDNATASFNYAYMLSGLPDHIYQDSKDYDNVNVDVFEFPNGLPGDEFVGFYKVGEAVGLLRNTISFDSPISPIAADFSFQPILNFLYEGGMADMIGYDGVYFFGFNFSIGDFFSARVGKHHYCTHYGDAVLKSIDHSRIEDFYLTYKYVRMNGNVIGISLEPFEGFRLYGEYNWLPEDISSWRPIIFRPSWIQNSKTTYPEEYKARIVNFGVELSYPIFKKLGKTTLAYDCHMYEEGKIVYKNPDGSYITDKNLIHYDPNASWQIEHGIVLNQEILDNISVEIGYHKGRAILNSMYYLEDSEWISFALKFNPDGKITLLSLGDN